ncbi:unnamed protein product [Ixodes pacificus]
MSFDCFSNITRATGRRLLHLGARPSFAQVINRPYNNLCALLESLLQSQLPLSCA